MLSLMLSRHRGHERAFCHHILRPSCVWTFDIFNKFMLMYQEIYLFHLECYLTRFLCYVGFLCVWQFQMDIWNLIYIYVLKVCPQKHANHFDIKLSVASRHDVTRWTFNFTSTRFKRYRTIISRLSNKDHIVKYNMYIRNINFISFYFEYMYVK